jgi:hypothetical protein
VAIIYYNSFVEKKTPVLFVHSRYGLLPPGGLAATSGASDRRPSESDWRGPQGASRKGVGARPSQGAGPTTATCTTAAPALACADVTGQLATCMVDTTARRAGAANNSPRQGNMAASEYSYDSCRYVLRQKQDGQQGTTAFASASALCLVFTLKL